MARNFEPGFFVEHFIKDMGIALAEAEKMNLCLPGLALAKQLYEAVQAQGYGRKGTQALMLALETINNEDVQPWFRPTPPNPDRFADGVVRGSRWPWSSAHAVALTDPGGFKMAQVGSLVYGRTDRGRNGRALCLDHVFRMGAMGAKDP